MWVCGVGVYVCDLKLNCGCVCGYIPVSLFGVKRTTLSVLMPSICVLLAI